MSELIFECYGAPSLSFGLDSLFAFHANSPPLSAAYPNSDGLVISSSTASTHVIPVLSGRGVLSRSKRCVPRPRACGSKPIPSFLRCQIELGQPAGRRAHAQAHAAEVPDVSRSSLELPVVGSDLCLQVLNMTFLTKRNRKCTGTTVTTQRTTRPRSAR